MADIEVDSDITRAKAIPSRFYHHRETHNRMMKAFSSSWLFAAHQHEMEKHNILPLPQMTELGEAMILTKSDAEGGIHCRSNVCTHRGMLVAQQPCHVKTLQCPYHGRTFSLDGKFRSMPEFAGVTDFPSPRDDLMEYDIDVWNGLLFTIFDNSSAESSSDFARIRDELEIRLGWLEVEKFRYDPSRDRDYSIAANWALYVDNYLEGLHIPHVHPDLNQTLDYDLYRTETFPGGVVQVGIAKPGEACFDLPESSPDHGQLIGAYYFWIFPNTMLNFYPWGLSVNIVIPSDVEETRILYRGYVGSVDDLGKGAGGDLDKVEAEDQSIVEAVQKGIKSSAFQRGRYSPNREVGVHHFHRMLIEFDH